MFCCRHQRRYSKRSNYERDSTNKVRPSLASVPLYVMTLLCFLQQYSLVVMADSEVPCAAVLSRGLWLCRFEYVPAQPEPLSDEVKAVMEEQGVDFETSGLKYLTNDARVSHR